MNVDLADLSRPAWWTSTAYPFLANEFAERYFAHFPRNRCDVVNEDWDNLLLLDACRFDLFEQVSDLEGRLGHRLSRGSNTGEFFEENFGNAEYHDTVYVTASPVPRVDAWCSVDVDSVFHAVVDVWEDHWDDDLNTVRPAPVASAVREALSKYPHKRIIGHFIQPHQPFIGGSGREIEESGMMAYNRLSGKEADPGGQIWKRLEDGEISPDRAWQAYRENLELVLPYVRDLREDLTGKTVVTSDHGNLFGEFAWPAPLRKYGHPRGVHTRKLIKVPWLETEPETRRRITSEPPVSTESRVDEEERIERLEHLGYR